MQNSSELSREPKNWGGILMILIQMENLNDSLYLFLLRKPLGTISLPLFLMKHILENDT